jgi:hypothetical protein
VEEIFLLVFLCPFLAHVYVDRNVSVLGAFATY